ncbi:envelope glycoprotein B [Testudinid alphaherpesvirus 3]|uniref:Glycoprotein B n=7 Tax=Testudinid alphaherpesvirus 3 TaxID=2560801 RepID=A0A0K1R142_9ALPH|nr:envelope glycoprotein B [Testudinid alphaherpesvirus 3]AKI81654.1 envelope glycoprotein B [Testudinid alphaherpesvirus 3]AKI81757.1 envelope glycoprotein B [Testudinid alphaherpesvirus 3]AKV40634.1 glycoprotein B [Testudinid alphaherpesvirus 3]AKV40635.1 glycoprotein B [Testudinid alphaherpesvirus 3]
MIMWLSFMMTLWSLSLVYGQTIVPPTDDVGISMSELMENITNTEGLNTNFTICGLSTGTDIVRLSPPSPCHKYTEDNNYDEGIAVIFKEDIVPYVFPLTFYTKEVTTLTTYKDLWEKSIGHRTTIRYALQRDEIIDVDTKHMCSTESKVYQANTILTLRHKDAGEKTMLPLYPSRFGTDTTSSYSTVNETYVEFTWVIAGYKTCTTVNCRVIDTIAKSPYPYNYFSLATGDVVEMSPFYDRTDETKTETMNEDPEYFWIFENYSSVDRKTKEEIPARRRAFLQKPEFLVSWDVKKKQEQVCSMKLWQSVENVIRVEQNPSYHFTAKELTATFTAPMDQFDIKRLVNSNCVPTEGKKEIDRIYSSRYKDTHLRVNETQYYLATGGFLIMYQPLIAKSIADLAANQKPPSRVRREAEEPSTGLIESVRTAAFLQIQYTYDKLQAHNNAMFSRIVYAWCELQNRDITMWEQLNKINPSAVMSAIMKRRVSAKKLGDVVAVSDCLTIPRNNVRLINSMYITKGNLVGSGVCYSRPLVVYTFGNSTESLYGHLGENNEIIPYVGLTENCEPKSRKLFLYENAYMLYENYNFVRMVPLTDIPEVSTYINLDLTMLENVDFVALDVYSAGELKEANVNNLDELLRFQAADRHAISTLANAVYSTAGVEFLKGIEKIFAGFGVVGEAIGKAIGTIGGALAGVVSGVVGFFSNPFGGFTIILLVAGGLVAAFLAFKFIQLYKKDPMKTLFPMTAKSLAQRDPSDPDNVEEMDDEARRETMLIARRLHLLSAEQRLAARDLKRRNLPKFLGRFRNRNGYSKLIDEDTELHEIDDSSQ